MCAACAIKCAVRTNRLFSFFFFNSSPSHAKLNTAPRFSLSLHILSIYIYILHSFITCTTNSCLCSQNSAKEMNTTTNSNNKKKKKIKWAPMISHSRSNFESARACADARPMAKQNGFSLYGYLSRFFFSINISLVLHVSPLAMYRYIWRMPRDFFVNCYSRNNTRAHVYIYILASSCEQQVTKNKKKYHIACTTGSPLGWGRLVTARYVRSVGVESCTFISFSGFYFCFVWLLHAALYRICTRELNMT